MYRLGILVILTHLVMNVFGDAVFVVFICWDLLRFFVYNMKIFPVQYFGDTNIHWDIDTSAQQKPSAYLRDVLYLNCSSMVLFEDRGIICGLFEWLNRPSANPIKMGHGQHLYLKLDMTCNVVFKEHAEITPCEQFNLTKNLVSLYY